MTARVVVDTSEMEGEVRGLMSRLTDFTKPLKAWGLYMVGETVETFRAQGRPVHWVADKVATLIARALRGTPHKREGKSGFQRGADGRVVPSSLVFKRVKSALGSGEVGALSTVKGFARNKAGRVSRRGHGGVNKFAQPGYAFRAAVIRAVTQGKILMDRGLLYRSISSKTESVTSSKMRVLIGTNVKYAGVHNFGFEGTDSAGRHQRIPKRQFYQILPENKDQLQDFLVDHCKGVV